MNTIEFGGTFWLTIVGLISAFLSGALVYAIKSKCSRCSLCFGVIDVVRNCELEEKIEELELEKGLNPFKNGEKP